jgi:haloalkane dehalogenase
MNEQEAVELFRRPPERWIDVGVGEVAYRRVGTGPDVLFVHGWPVHSATFRGLLPHLADHVTCHLIDLPGAGASRWADDRSLDFSNNIAVVRRVIDELGLQSVAVVGHDSGGLVVRHAVAGDPRVRAVGLIDTEQPQGLTWRFKVFLVARRMPGIGASLGWVAGRRRLRRNPLVFGGAFVDRTLLDGDFEEFFLRPLAQPRVRNAAVRLLKTFDTRKVDQLADVHRRIDVPVQLVWGARDLIFPVARAREMVGSFPDARLEVVDGAAIFSHEERPAEVARALLKVLV